MIVTNVTFSVLAMLAQGGTLSAGQAGAHIGETATVQGKVSVQRTRDGETYIHVGGNGSNAPMSAPMSAYVSRWNKGKFQDVDRLDGKNVQITGQISTFRGKPEIFLTDPGQISAAPEPAPAPAPAAAPK
jgi:DNA/RNA endonuclease YhcR with UshA esterase domain